MLFLFCSLLNILKLNSFVDINHITYYLYTLGNLYCTFIILIYRGRGWLYYTDSIGITKALKLTIYKTHKILVSFNA